MVVVHDKNKADDGRSDEGNVLLLRAQAWMGNVEAASEMATEAAIAEMSMKAARRVSETR